MAETDNFEVINENFETIKTILNSIRTQGILNTSDVDKILSEINSKLEKLDNEDDIDIIKVFLNELKEGNEERYNRMSAKFAAIETAYSDLLKHSSQQPKSNEIKEIFDVIAANLSIFSKEVLSQKDTLSQIGLKLETMASDESRKEDIIKSITVLKFDINRINNGFDSIILSLNENFKTLAKTLTELDKTEDLNSLSNTVRDVYSTMNTLLSQVESIYNKSNDLGNSLEDVVNKEDLAETAALMNEIKSISEKISSSFDGLETQYSRIGDLSEKIDASVDIIAGLKSLFEEQDSRNTNTILDKLSVLEDEVRGTKDEKGFNDFITSLKSITDEMSESDKLLQLSLNGASEDINKIMQLLQSLDINTNFANVSEKLSDVVHEIKTSIDSSVSDYKTQAEANLKKILGDISCSTDVLSDRISNAHSELAQLCEKSFDSLCEDITGLKGVISQIDDNAVKTGNEMFSNITDRLSAFEASFSEIVNNQNSKFSQSSSVMSEQIENIKALSDLLDYKIDASAVDVGSIKSGFETLKESVDAVLALNFTDKIKDLKSEMFTVKEQLDVALEGASNSLSEKLSNDIYGKYELLSGKVDSVESELKNTQKANLEEIKAVINGISSAVVDVISYVDEIKTYACKDYSSDFSDLNSLVKDINLTGVETLKSLLDTLQVQIETNLKNIEDVSIINFRNLEKSINDKTVDIKTDIQNSYDKIIELKELYGYIKSDIEAHNLKNVQNFEKFETSTSEINKEFDLKLNEIKANLIENLDGFKSQIVSENSANKEELCHTLEAIHDKSSKESSDNFEELKGQIYDIALQNKNSSTSNSMKIMNEIEELRKFIISHQTEYSENNLNALNDITEKISLLSSANEAKITSVSGEISNGIESIKDFISNTSSANAESRERTASELAEKLESIKDFISNTSSANAESREKTASELAEKLESIKDFISNTSSANAESREKTAFELCEKLTSLSDSINDMVKVSDESNAVKFNYLADKIESLKQYITDDSKTSHNDIINKITEMRDCFDDVKDVLGKIDENVDGDLTRQISIIESNFESFVVQMSAIFDKKEDSLTDRLKNEIGIASENISEHLSNKFDEYKTTVESLFGNLSSQASEQTSFLKKRVEEMDSEVHSALEHQSEFNINQLNIIEEKLKAILDENIKIKESDYDELKNKVGDFAQEIANGNVSLIQNIKSQIDDITKYLNSVIDINEQETTSKYNDLNALLERAVATISEKTNNINTLDESIESLKEQIELQKNMIESSQAMVESILKSEVEYISKTVERGTEDLVSDLSEQFNMLKQAQNDSVTDITSAVENIISDHVYNNIEDLKAYFNANLSTDVYSEKLDNLKLDILSVLEKLVINVNKMIDSDNFASALSDFRLANEILINTAIDGINDKIRDFIKENMSSVVSELSENAKSIESKLSLFDKKFVETLTDKYEEIKLESMKNNESLNMIRDAFESVRNDLKNANGDVSEKLYSLVEKLENMQNDNFRELSESFDKLREQVLNNIADNSDKEEYKKQLNEIESMVREQLGYLDDINELCVNSLPDVVEVNSILKNSIISKLDGLLNRISSDESTLANDLKTVKSDIINQILNVFNQISFVTEQEEILDFIQEKHDELIAVLSHMVTSTEDIATIKNEVRQINQKINNIISSNGDIDYIYSLQDIESDIANLRIVLNEMKENSQNDEIKNLAESTEGIYRLVETIKNELPTREEFENISEDLVSISTRTNKLILASDESYKMLQDNIQGFRLVIDDLDERTRNFAEESGMNKIDSKLNAINNMMINGARSNQVFNQVFEYLAEWVDSASTQINTMENKIDKVVETTGKKTKVDTKSMEETLKHFLSEIGSKMELQQKKIDILEKSLSEIKSMLNEKETASLTKKIGGMDKQIAKLNKSIEKLASNVIEK